MSSSTNSVANVPLQRGLGFIATEPDKCIHFPHAILVGLIAGGAIALIVSTLFLLAQHGVPLGGLNAFTHAISPNLVYFSMGFSAGSLIFGTVLLVMLIRNYLNRTYSKAEVINLNAIVEQWVSFATFDTERLYYHLPNGFIFMKEGTKISMIAFKLDRDRERYIQNLENKGYIPFKPASTRPEIVRDSDEHHSDADSTELTSPTNTVLLGYHSDVPIEKEKEPISQLEVSSKSLPVEYTKEEVSKLTGKTFKMPESRGPLEPVSDDQYWADTYYYHGIDYELHMLLTPTSERYFRNKQAHLNALNELKGHKMYDRREFWSSIYKEYIELKQYLNEDKVYLERSFESIPYIIYKDKDLDQLAVKHFKDDKEKQKFLNDNKNFQPLATWIKQRYGIV